MICLVRIVCEKYHKYQCSPEQLLPCIQFVGVVEEFAIVLNNYLNNTWVFLSHLHSIVLNEKIKCAKVN